MPHECTRGREVGRYTKAISTPTKLLSPNPKENPKGLVSCCGDERTNDERWGAMARGVLVWTMAIAIVMAASMVPVSLLVNSIVPHPYMVCHSHSVSVCVSLSFLIV
jgi:hypothetical protein